VPSGAADGIVVGDAGASATAPVLVADGIGGATLAWDDDRTAFREAFVERMDAGDALPWGGRGVVVGSGAVTRTGIAAASDLSGGAYVAWEEHWRERVDVFAQRVSSAGVPQWAATGVPVCAAGGSRSDPAVAMDLLGIVIAMTDTRAGNNDIYVQRLSTSGIPQWTAAGVAMCADAGAQSDAIAIADGGGAATLVWRDFRADATGDVFARRVSSAGVPQGAANGTPLCSAAGRQTAIVAAADGAGGAVVAWQDARAGNDDVYARRFTSAGSAAWTSDGVALCTAAGNQTVPAIVSGGANGAIVAWQDGRDAAQADVYARRVDGAGTPQWSANGVAVCTAPGDQLAPVAVIDDAGGAIVAWQDWRTGDADGWAQRVSAAGAAQWAANGVALTGSGTAFTSPALAWDGAAAFAAWPDMRVGKADVYAQRVGGSGALQWPLAGYPVAIQPGTQAGIRLVASGTSAAIGFWTDERSGHGSAVYAAQLVSSGPVAVPEPVAPGHAWLAAPVPNPARGETTFRFALPAPADVRLGVFDVTGREVRRLFAGACAAGERTATWDGRDVAGRALPGGVYWVRLVAGAHCETRVTVRMR
jgi:hypothetical protein